MYFRLEPYLETVDNATDRRQITKLRLSAHRLNIELLRGTVSDPALRLCKECDLGETEDEEHFLLRCKAYSDIRNTFLTEISRTVPNTLTYDDSHWYIFLLTNEDKAICKALGKFVHTEKHRKH